MCAIVLGMYCICSDLDYAWLYNVHAGHYKTLSFHSIDLDSIDFLGTVYGAHKFKYPISIA